MKVLWVVYCHLWLVSSPFFCVVSLCAAHRIFLSLPSVDEEEESESTAAPIPHSISMNCRVIFICRMDCKFLRSRVSSSSPLLLLFTYFDGVAFVSDCECQVCLLLNWVGEIQLYYYHFAAEPGEAIECLAGVPMKVASFDYGSENAVNWYYGLVVFVFVSGPSQLVPSCRFVHVP